MLLGGSLPEELRRRELERVWLGEGFPRGRKRRSLGDGEFSNGELPSDRSGDLGDASLIEDFGHAT